MSKTIAFILFFAVAFCYASKEANATIYLRPGDRGELSFTVVNSSDSVDLLNTPQVVYENQPQWFTMGAFSVLSHSSLAQGTSCELLIDYEIAQNAPSGTSDLKFKVVFSNPNVYPPVWYPAANEKVIIDGSVPSLSIIQLTLPRNSFQPNWLEFKHLLPSPQTRSALNYSASCAV